MKALINAITYDFKEFKKDQYIMFNREIIETGAMENFKGADEVINCCGCIVLPGLTNCHTHIYSTFSRGMTVPFNPKNFKDILTQLWWKLDKQLNADSVYYSGLVYGIDCIRNGVTSIVDHHASGLYIAGSLNELKRAICDELGMRGIFCFEASDRFNLGECIEENMKFSELRTEHCAGLMGLHASMSLCDNSLSQISNCSGELPIHIHVAESMDDVEDCISSYGKGIVERLDRFGLLRRNSILSHCVHIREDEASLISDRQCYIAMNTTSNMNNSVGLPNYKMFKKNGIKCLAGNDGLGSNMARDYGNLVYSMKHRLGSPLEFSLEDLMEVINNGYEYIGSLLNIKIGRIKSGYKADLLVIPYVPPTPLNEKNIMAHVFFGVFDNFHPREVWVAGRRLLCNFQLTFDEEEILLKAREEAQSVWDRIHNS